MKKLIMLCIAGLGICLTPSMHAQSAKEIPPNLINVSSSGIKKTAQFKIWKSNIEYTDKVGKFSNGIFCVDSTDIPYNKNLDQYNVTRLGKVYADRSSALGYPKFDGDESAFAEKMGSEADFKVGFTLLSMNYNICGDSKEVSGNSSVKLKIELFSTALKKIVYSKAIEGKFASDKKIKMEDFDEALFAAALDNIFADKKYADLFRDAAAVDTLMTDRIEIANGAKLADGVKKNSKDLLNSVVTVESGLGVGTGFYVGKDGYIISNYHVVGEARFVKIKFSTGHSIIGEVIRKDTVRDVALIKTASEPPTQISIRKTPVKIGEEVYAIGSPFGEQLSGTLTRGIVSAERTLKDLKFIQSDVSINPGNSGGPLVDSAGQVVAVAELKKEDAAGIGLFIPVSEALEKLGINLK